MVALWLLAVGLGLSVFPGQDPAWGTQPKKLGQKPEIVIATHPLGRGRMQRETRVAERGVSLADLYETAWSAHVGRQDVSLAKRISVFDSVRGPPGELSRLLAGFVDAAKATAGVTGADGRSFELRWMPHQLGLKAVNMGEGAAVKGGGMPLLLKVNKLGKESRRTLRSFSVGDAEPKKMEVEVEACDGKVAPRGEGLVERVTEGDVLGKALASVRVMEGRGWLVVGLANGVGREAEAPEGEVSGVMCALGEALGPLGYGLRQITFRTFLLADGVVAAGIGPWDGVLAGRLGRR